LSQDDIFIARAMEAELVEDLGNGGVRRPRSHEGLKKAYLTTARTGPSVFAINAGAKAQAPSRQSATIACASIDGLTCYRLRRVHAPGHVASHLARCHAGPRSTPEDTRCLPASA
jgi:hypothetical protein